MAGCASSFLVLVGLCLIGFARRIQAFQVRVNQRTGPAFLDAHYRSDGFLRSIRGMGWLCIAAAVISLVWPARR